MRRIRSPSIFANTERTDRTSEVLGRRHGETMGRLWIRQLARNVGEHGTRNVTLVEGLATAHHYVRPAFDFPAQEDRRVEDTERRLVELLEEFARLDQLCLAHTTPIVSPTGRLIPLEY